MTDLPFFLSFIIFITIAVTMRTRTAQTIIVPIFELIHDSTGITPFVIVYLVLIASFLLLIVSFVASLYGLKSM